MVRASRLIAAAGILAALSLVPRASPAADPRPPSVVIGDAAVPEALRAELRAEPGVTLVLAEETARQARRDELQRLLAEHLAAVSAAPLLVVATADGSGLYALLELASRGTRLRDTRVVVADELPRPVARVLGAVLFRVLEPRELVLGDARLPMRALWQGARDAGRDLAAAEWGGAPPVVISPETIGAMSPWRRALVDAWAHAVPAGVSLSTMSLVLVLPIIACIVLLFRSVVGIETFGTFAPVIVTLAFLVTGLAWGLAIFAIIVGCGVVMRSALEWVRVQLMTRLAILITLVSAMMAAIIVGGAYFGIGALQSVSIFPMVVMAHVIETFTTTQVELGTREALRVTLNTCLVCAIAYGVIESAGLQAMVVCFPEILLGVVVIEVIAGRWRGLRLLEYGRFAALATRGRAVP
jgi:hypothetical protein